MVPKNEVSKSSLSNVGPLEDTKKSREVDSVSKGVKDSVSQGVKDSVMQIKETAAAVKETQEDASITPPSVSGTITNAFGESLNPSDVQRDQAKPIAGFQENNPKSQHIVGQKKVQFSVASKANPQGNICLVFLNRSN